MKILRLLCSLLLFTGCSEQLYQDHGFRNQLDFHPDIKKEQKLTGFSLSLPPLSSLWDEQHHYLQPFFINNQKMIVYKGNHPVLIQTSPSQEVIKEFDDIELCLSPVITKSHLLFYTKNQEIVIIDLNDYSIVSKVKLEHPLLSRPVVLDDDSILLQYKDPFVERVTNDFKRCWKVHLPGNSERYHATGYEPIADRDKVYIGSASAQIFALSLDSGAVLWSYKAHNSLQKRQNALKQFVYFSQPLEIVGDKIVGATSEGNILCIDAKSGSLVQSLMSVADVNFLVQNNTLYYVSDLSEVIALDLMNYQQDWKSASLAPLKINSLSFFQEKIFVNGIQPHLFVLNTGNGALLAHYKHAYHHARLLASIQDNSLYGVDKFGVFFKLPVE